MEAPLYVSKIRLENAGPLHRRATLETGDVADFGVHGAIRVHYGLAPDRERALPVDWIVAATGG